MRVPHSLIWILVAIILVLGIIILWAEHVSMHVHLWKWRQRLHKC